MQFDCYANGSSDGIGSASYRYAACAASKSSVFNTGGTPETNGLNGLGIFRQHEEAIEMWLKAGAKVGYLIEIAESMPPKTRRAHLTAALMLPLL